MNEAAMEVFAAIGCVATIFVVLGIAAGIVNVLLDRHSEAVANAKELEVLRDRVAEMPDARMLEQMHADCRMLSEIGEILARKGE